MKILGTGLSGLVGSRIVDLLKDSCIFENLSLKTGCDITNKKSVFEKIKGSDAKVVLHLAAKANVDACEEDKEKDIEILRHKDIIRAEEEWIKEKTAWAVNVLGTRNVIEACCQTGKRLVYISTDFVFDGEKASPYSEEAQRNPLNWYAKTKFEAENLVQNSPISWTILRIAYPYRASFMREDFVRILINFLKNKKGLKMINDHIMTPTFIDDIAVAVLRVIEENLEGIFHAVGSQFISPYESALLVADVFNYDSKLIEKTTREEYFKGRAVRPFRLQLKNDKIKKLGLKMSTFEEGLEEIKRQMKTSNFI